MIIVKGWFELTGTLMEGKSEMTPSGVTMWYLTSSARFRSCAAEFALQSHMESNTQPLKFVSFAMDAHEKRIKEQRRKYTKSIAKGCASEALAELSELARDAGPTDYFKKRWDVLFWYEKLDKEGLGERAKDIADRWAEV